MNACQCTVTYMSEDIRKSKYGGPFNEEVEDVKTFLLLSLVILLLYLDSI